MTVEPQAWWWVWYWSHENYQSCALQRGESVSWTCNEATRVGDFALLYVKRPTSALVALLQATTDAHRDPTARQYTIHPWGCGARVVRVLKQVATLPQLRADRWLSGHWGLISANFQASRGKAPRVPQDVMDHLCQHIPELARYVPSKRATAKMKTNRRAS